MAGSARGFSLAEDSSGSCLMPSKPGAVSSLHSVSPGAGDWAGSGSLGRRSGLQVAVSKALPVETGNLDFQTLCHMTVDLGRAGHEESPGTHQHLLGGGPSWRQAALHRLEEQIYIQMCV